MLNPTIARKEVTQHILKTFAIKAKKSIGQNFLVSPSIVDSIIDIANIEAGQLVLEIGPGLGTLTQAIAEAQAEVIAVELDGRMIKVMSKTLAGYNNVKVVQGDILAVDLASLTNGRSFKVVANLPYYITTPIVMALLEQGLPISEIIVMVQKEVAERFTAQAGTKAYGAVTVAMQYYAEAEIALIVPPTVFIPAPEVTSCVMRLRVRQSPPVQPKDKATFFALVKACFTQRRKTLQNNLKAQSLSAASLDEVQAATQIDLNRRAETLSIEEFTALADAVYDARQTK